MNARIIEIEGNYNILVEGELIYEEYKDLRVLTEFVDSKGFRSAPKNEKALYCIKGYSYGIRC